MKTFIQNGDIITVPAPAGGTVSGKLYKVGAFIGVAATTEAAGDPVELKLTGVFELTKTSAQAWAVGDLVYMNTTSGSLSNASATGLVLVGAATEAAANPSAVGRVRLNGVSAPAAAT
ncbi:MULTISPECIES: DUF2190 family protein [Pseudomonas]|uniref:DUF2190 family protein n=1 Tax=Pseudomonas TaxID=286 RepID=UPI00073084D6|nr:MULTISPECIES: DUF2190 family protein [Pseudomonas]KSW22769.1 hypothetical protein AOX63_04950 [Pseudomonas sp. ADP]OBP09715.1 hypothetical protein BAE52_17815 [Pseudomonas sp. EGD-AKN5]QOF85590.1 DUF2190 family protein [Pseudomonas sp. ADPe]